MATKEATEIKEEAVAPKAPIKEEDAAKALEKEDQGKNWRRGDVKGSHMFSLNFEFFSKKKFFIKTKEKLNFNRTFEQKMKPNMFLIPAYIGNMETKYSSFPPYYEKCPANYEKIWHIKSLYYGGNENFSFSS